MEGVDQLENFLQEPVDEHVVTCQDMEVRRIEEVDIFAELPESTLAQELVAGLDADIALWTREAE